MVETVELEVSSSPRATAVEGKLKPRDIAFLGQLLPAAATQHGRRSALTVGDRTLSFAQLNELAGRVAASLLRRGVVRGDRVSICGPNSVEWVAAYHGALRIGACVNPLNGVSTADEISYVLRDCASSALFASDDRLAPLHGSAALASLKVAVNLTSGISADDRRFERFIADATPLPDFARVDPTSLSTIAYTSGTTGRPKGAIHSHTNVMTNIRLTALLHGREARDVIVTALPCAHVYGNVVMNSALLTGAHLVLHPRFDEPAVLASIRRHRATIFEAVPTMYLYLLNHPDLELTDLSSLRLCTVGGQTMAVAKMQAVESRFGCPLVELWGMTELAGLGTTFRHDGQIKHGSIGLPLPGIQAKIVDTADLEKVLDVDQPGELMIRGPVVMQGYFNNVAATREAIDAEGWLHTGDIARRDAQGFIYIVDRKQDMILTGGYNVYPAEIERVLSEHPQVAIAAVGGVADEIKGELPKAYVVLKAGGTTDASALLAYCRERLAAYKVPRLVQFVTDLPRTSSGKIMRRRLRELDAHE